MNFKNDLNYWFILVLWKILITKFDRASTKAPPKLSLSYRTNVVVETDLSWFDSLMFVIFLYEVSSET